jgi:hypothetical protein
MAEVSNIVQQLGQQPFAMKLPAHKFSELKGLDLLQKVRLHPGVRVSDCYARSSVNLVLVLALCLNPTLVLPHSA